MNMNSGQAEHWANQAAKTGQVALAIALGIGEAMVRGALQMGQATVDMMTQWSESTSQQLYRFLEQTTEGVGHTATFVAELPLIRPVLSFFKLDWLINSDSVDLSKAQSEVQKLQRQYPHESPREIAQRIIAQKAFLASGMGFASSLLPGVAAALLAVDLAATTVLQTEMIYQIAAAYGLDLRDPARRGEVLGIFGLALGGSNAVKAGLGIFRNLPFAGSFIGASTNATVLYALGYAACAFYEAKAQSPETVPSPETLSHIRHQTEQYWATAEDQAVLIDQILAHMLLASYPQKTWSEIVPELEHLEISAASRDAIAEHLQSPQPLDTVLDQLNSDFAVPVLARCYRIAEADGQTTPEEQQVLEAIANRFGLDLNQVKANLSNANGSGLYNATNSSMN
jgi:uncharacterized protein (DUF697 family)